MSLQKKDKQASREKLVYILDRYFISKKANVTLHLDGHPAGRVSSSKMKIVYSENLTADEKIKKQISPQIQILHNSQKYAQQLSSPATNLP